MSKSTLEVKGIGTATSLLLAEHGFKTAKDLANATVKTLSAVPGFGIIRSAQVIADASALKVTKEPKAKKVKIKDKKTKKTAKKEKEPSKKSKAKAKSKKDKVKKDNKKSKKKSKK